MRKLLPMIVRPSVNPTRYYDAVGDHMVWLMRDRRVSMIRQRDGEAELVIKLRHEDGSSLPILVSNKEELLDLVRRGGVDFMASIGKIETAGVDMLVVDIKADRYVWLHERGLRAMHAVTRAIELGLEYLGFTNKVTIFDGMNGFKIMSPLSTGMSKDAAKSIVNLLSDAAARAIKSLDIGSIIHGITVGSNTMVKVGMFRIPLSMHWSTKLASIPVTCVEDFAAVNADPARTMSNLNHYSRILERLRTSNEVSPNWDSDVITVYRIKNHIRRELRISCE